ncbi:hypothetical protein GCM10027048_42810 [Hymenobacter coalescens]
MIIYGHNSTHLRSGPVPAACCPACGTPESLRMSVFGRYAHVYWIPLFGIGKTGGVQCGRCRCALRHDELPEPLQPHFSALKARTHAPLWHFAGLLLLGLAALGSPAVDAWQHHRDEQRLAHPHVGDVYYIRAEEPGYYTLLKVVEVNGNSVRLRSNHYETDLEAEVDDLDLPKNYDAEPFDLTQFDLQIMQQQQELLAVVRTQ